MVPHQREIRMPRAAQTTHKLATARLATSLEGTRIATIVAIARPNRRNNLQTWEAPTPIQMLARIINLASSLMQTRIPMAVVSRRRRASRSHAKIARYSSRKPAGILLRTQEGRQLGSSRRITSGSRGLTIGTTATRMNTTDKFEQEATRSLSRKAPEKSGVFSFTETISNRKI
jgi:hypothetical protein